MPIPFHNSQYLMSKYPMHQGKARILCISATELCLTGKENLFYSFVRLLPQINSLKKRAGNITKGISMPPGMTETRRILISKSPVCRNLKLII